VPGHDDVTVVIPCFNYGGFLDEAVASVEAQDGGAPQIIVVDDGSTDDTTCAVIDRLDDRVTVIRQPNAGVCAARNTGMTKATTPLIALLDADDKLAPGSLIALKRALDANPRAGYAYGQIELFGDQKGLMGFPPFDPWRLLFRHIVGPTALIRREVVDRVGGFDDSFGYEDWEYWLHALALGWPGVLVPQPVMLYRKHGASRFDTARVRYHDEFRRLRRKHAGLYGNLGAVAQRSSLSFPQRQLYRWVWGYRPWPAKLENAVYGILWRK
jgi:glycosyltransferase involved in cell wall biosynthesis